MKQLTIIICIFQQLIIICSGSCQVIRAPTNMAVLVGGRLDMTCQPEKGFIVRAWIYQPPFSYTDLKIYANWSVPRMHIDHFGYDTDIDDSINIYLNSTGLEDAGTYNCYVQLVSRQPESYSAQVIVLGKLNCPGFSALWYMYMKVNLTRAIVYTVNLHKLYTNSTPF